MVSLTDIDRETVNHHMVSLTDIDRETVNHHMNCKHFIPSQ